MIAGHAAMDVIIPNTIVGKEVQSVYIDLQIRIIEGKFDGKRPLRV
jgi:hypothetical protein